ncbi:MAG: chromate efflux transporter [Thiothrix sp.]|nr:chromate efflux transporter [Thiothrix sp.]HPQ95612.1 chromate efflux transporter [Thiolinea sp.]
MPPVFDVFRRFLWLGCLSFGGPAAHIGYFRQTFVQQLQWLDERSYANLVALSQFLPGPGSSQVGFALGLRRAGLAGGLAAFAGFTLPSFVLMLILASVGASALNTGMTGVIAGLKLLAVVVVADAVVSMYRSFCRDGLTLGIMLLTAMTLWLLPGLWTQLGVLLAAALAGMSVRGRAPDAVRTAAVPMPVRDWRWPLGLFLLLFALTLVPGPDWSRLFAAFFQAGSLVFGGGHVVLPLLEQLLGDQLSTDRFLTGYAAAQAVPGPMFTLATFLGAELAPDHAFVGALVATLGIFLPGFLLVLALQGRWERLAARPQVAGAVAGINAAVVGLLLAALYVPVFRSAVTEPLHMALVLGGYVLLTRLGVPVVALVSGFAVTGWLVLA